MKSVILGTRIDSDERTPERGPVGGGKEIRCLSEKDSMEGVVKIERESRKEVLEQARQRYGKRGREGRSRLLVLRAMLCA
jgi:hypothetical protein